MRTTTPPEFLTFLNTGAPWRRANLLTLTLASGVVVRLSDYDLDIFYNGHTWPRAGLVFKREGVVHKVGVEVVSLKIAFFPSPRDLLDGVRWNTAVRAGALDYASVRLDIAGHSIEDPHQLLGMFNWFEGQVAEVSPLDGFGLEVTIKSDVSRLDILMPRNVVGPGCLNVLGDRVCRVGLSTETVVTFDPQTGYTTVPPRFAFTGTVTGLLSDGALQVAFATAHVNTPGFYNEGELVLTSGQNKNAVRKVKENNASGIYVSAPFAFSPVGASFRIVAGCDHTRATCRDKFTNLLNYRGIDFVPNPETVL